MNQLDMALYRRPDGCHLHDACLTCPRETCILDDLDAKPKPVRADRMLAAYYEIRAAYQEQAAKGKVNSVALAQRFGVSKRTVFRAARYGQQRA